MATQDVRELVPRVRRAVEGARSPASGALTDEELEAMTADAVADIILLSGGAFGHKLLVTETEDSDGISVPKHWAVEEPLAPEEETLVATQAALGALYMSVRTLKTSEHIKEENREWQWQVSASAVSNQLKALQEQRDAALATLTAANPAMARTVSTLAVRDAVGAALLEPWTQPGGVGGGQALLGA